MTTQKSQLEIVQTEASTLKRLKSIIGKPLQRVLEIDNQHELGDMIENQHITALQIENQNLETFREEVFQFPNLICLSVINNHLSTIPKQ
jgi:hypothetical protein